MMGEPKNIEFGDFEPTSAKLGSNQGGFFRRKADGKEFYIKWETQGPQDGKYKDRIRNRFNNEFLANKLYELFGLAVPTSEFITFKDGSGKTCYGIMSEKIDGLKMVREVTRRQFETIKPLAQEGFLIDALLSNYDVVGPGGHNLHFNESTGAVVRVDPGASLKYLARGAAKKGIFNAEVNEFEEFVSGDNRKTGFHEGALKRAGMFFSGVYGSPQLAKGLATLKSVTERQIIGCVLAHGWDHSTPKGRHKNDVLIATLLARRSTLIDKAESKLGAAAGACVDTVSQLKAVVSAVRDAGKASTEVLTTKPDSHG
jgi:hypothetical protein